MEEEAERIFQDERALLRGDEAASARDTMLVQETWLTVSVWVLVLLQILGKCIKKYISNHFGRKH